VLSHPLLRGLRPRNPLDKGTCRLLQFIRIFHDLSRLGHRVGVLLLIPFYLIWALMVSSDCTPSPQQLESLDTRNDEIATNNSQRRRPRHLVYSSHCHKGILLHGRLCDVSHQESRPASLNMRFVGTLSRPTTHQAETREGHNI
jgi:hypothetical protein